MYFYEISQIVYIWCKSLRVKYLFAVILLSFLSLKAQTDWPATSWNSAANLTAILDSDGTAELSGLHWNQELFRLYVVHGDGRLHVLQYSPGTGLFNEIADKFILGGPEGITMVNPLANEFYTIDENNYEIRKYVHGSNYGGITLSRKWDLLSNPSPMEDTGNIGPEGIAFVPDDALEASGFISSEFNVPYVSTKGMGGLMFIAHQDEGYVWVYDVNPNVSDDFVFVGKYLTNRSESCDLAFDRSTGLLYILHNIDSNYVEITDLSSSEIGGERKFDMVTEYFLPSPDENVNLEGFALMDQCTDTGLSAAWICRDVEISENDEIKFDALRFFSPFDEGADCSLNTVRNNINSIVISPNPAHSELTVRWDNLAVDATIKIFTISRRLLFEKRFNDAEFTISVNEFAVGSYLIQVNEGIKTTYKRFVRN